MDGDRKYSQRGYMESDRGPRNGNGHGNGHGDDRQKPQGLRPPLDITGPRLPRLVQTVTASRCYNCSTQLPEDADFSGNCPKCGTALHCCKQCAQFEPSTRFQCLKPIPVRIAVKDQANQCELFKPRVTVARDASGAASKAPSPQSAMSGPPRNASDARSAFDALFKK